MSSTIDWQAWPAGQIFEFLGVQHSLRVTFLASGSAGSRRFLILQAQFRCDDHTLEGGPSIPLVDDPDRRDRLERLLQEEDMAWKLGSPPESLHIHLEGGNFLTVIRNGYRRDTLFSKVIRNVAQHPRYAMCNGVLYFMNAVGDPVIAIPGSLSKGRRVTEKAIDQAYRIIGHKAARKTRDVACWYWSSVAMDFMGPPPEVPGHDYYPLFFRMPILSHRAPQPIPQQAQPKEDCPRCPGRSHMSSLVFQKAS